jgi:ATP-dependent RNA helicase DDX31/DBP7
VDAMTDSDYDIDCELSVKESISNGMTTPQIKSFDTADVTGENPPSDLVSKAVPKLIEKNCIKNIPFQDGNLNFLTLGVHPVLAAHLSAQLDIKIPTAIQSSVLPHFLQPLKISEPSSPFSRDVAIQSSTGSGKTLSFLIPLVQALQFANPPPVPVPSREIGPLALILAPTRELAQQIAGVLASLSNISRSAFNQVCDGELKGASDPNTNGNNFISEWRHWVVCSTLVGGEKKKAEKARIRKGINVIVSTPGRFLDHLRTTKSLDVSKLRWIILDEADRLLDLGFERDLKAIFAYFQAPRDENVDQNFACRNKLSRPLSPAWPSRRQVIVCSATLDKINHLTSWALHDPVLVVENFPKSNLNVDKRSFSNGPTSLSHEYAEVPLKLKLIVLTAFLEDLVTQIDSKSLRMMIFFSTRAAVDFYHALFEHHFQKGNSHRVRQAVILKLHGSLPQDDRKSALAQLSQSSQKVNCAQILFTTDVSARGIDLANIDTIIQFDAPTDVSEYVHRAGRTARAGKKGRAVLFLAPHELEFATAIVSPHLTHSGGLKLFDVASFVSKVLRCQSSAWELEATRRWQMKLEAWVHKEVRKFSILSNDFYILS